MIAVALALTTTLAAPQSATDAALPAALPLGLERWPAESRGQRLDRDRALVRAIDGAALARWHELVASIPHAAGTAGDAEVIARLVSSFEGLGLEVERHDFVAYLSEPISASLDVLSPVEESLPLEEAALPGSSFSAADDLGPLRRGWNAYSGSGVAEGEVVYANYGRREDFLRLSELGVDCTGKIVVARYGGNFRGYKAKYAELAGAAGLIIYTDPRDSGFGRGIETPEGGWANCDQIQRGSLLTVPWAGDPLTPDVEAKADAERLDPTEIDLPTIPVQPVGWFAASQIMRRMRGDSVPGEWQGGLPFRYRLSGGAELRVRLAVEQRRRLVPTANVVATLRGTESDPDDAGVLIGCHHDAWIYGADDPTSGLIGVLECARVLSAAAQEHGAPRRTITFAAWGAEEHGIIGSTEWVEGNLERLRAKGALYINLDAAASGLRVGISASPTLETLLQGAAAVVPHPLGGTALEQWQGAREELPRVGFLGGGSDHVSFLAKAALPSASVGARGAPGTAYHSLYDDLAWYRRVVGSDYASAALVARMTAVAADRAARAPVLPFGIEEPIREAAGALESMLAELAPLDAKGRALELLGSMRGQEESARKIEAMLDAAARGSATGERRGRINAALRSLERVWLVEGGLPGRPWFQNRFTAPDETSGYASWSLPEIRAALLRQDASLVASGLAGLDASLTQHSLGVMALFDELQSGEVPAARPAREPADARGK